MNLLKKDMVLMLSFCLLAAGSAAAWGAPGDTVICTWKDNKQSAFSFVFDDSMLADTDIAMPELLRRGFTATFFVNPGDWFYHTRKDIWENYYPAHGFEMANHGWTHTTVDLDYAEVDSTVGRCSQKIQSLYPNQSKLTLAVQGGGTHWNVSFEQRTEIFTRHYCWLGRGDMDNGAMVADAWESVDFYIKHCAKWALDNPGKWAGLGFHGIGPHDPTNNWLPVSTEGFLAILDYVHAHTDKLWVCGCLEGHKYKKERESARVVTLEASSSLIRLNLTSTAAFNGDTTQYDCPLTLRTEVPADWTYCKVTQGANTKIYPVTGGIVQHTVGVPNNGEIRLERSEADE